MDYFLETQHISKKFGQFVALDDVSISIKKGSIFGLLGPNGAGKTTLIRIITKIYAADEGHVYFNGRLLTQNDVLKIGYLPEERGLYKKMKVGDQLMYLAQLKGLKKAQAREKIFYWLEKFDIKTWWHKKVDELSKGMQQKIQFITTVLHEPKLIILDEPFTGFDPVNANIIKNEILRLREEGATIIFSTHRMDSVEELCDHIALINKSRKIIDGPKQVIKEEHKQNIFEIEHFGDLSNLNGHIRVLSSKPISDNLFKTMIQSDGEPSYNDLIRQIIDKVEVRGFAEKLPTINEIFIDKVQGGKYE